MLASTNISYASFAGTNGKILFNKSNNGYSGLYSINENGSGLQNLTWQSNGNIFSASAWSSDGNHVFYAKGGNQTDSAIYVANTDGSNEQRVSQMGIYGRFSLSPDGSLIVASDSINDCTAIIDIETGDSDCVLDQIVENPIWSQDGYSIVYNEYGTIKKLNLATGEVTQLTNHAGYSFPVDWSPDGQKIAYISTLYPTGIDGNEFRLYFMNSDGSGRTGFDDSIIARGYVGIYDAAFSPDGSSVVYSISEEGPNGTHKDSIKLARGFTVNSPTTVLSSDATWQSSVDWQSIGNPNPSSLPQPTPNTTPISRFYSPLLKHHLFTADANEAEYIKSHYPSSIWTFETTAFKVKATANCAADESVYRFYSEVLKTHLFTMDENEKSQIIANFPPSVWRYEGVAYCANSDQGRDTKPVYRFYSELLKTHLYTMDENETDYIIQNYDDSVWRFEGVAYYAYPN